MSEDPPKKTEASKSSEQQDTFFIADCEQLMEGGNFLLEIRLESLSAKAEELESLKKVITRLIRQLRNKNIEDKVPILIDYLTIVEEIQAKIESGDTVFIRDYRREINSLAYEMMDTADELLNG